jgi:hypothetical protein
MSCKPMNPRLGKVNKKYFMNLHLHLIIVIFVNMKAMLL